MSAHPEISDKDKKNILQNYYVDKKIFCMIDGEEIKPEQDIEFHHINPFLINKKPEKSNIGVVCKSHHREIGQFSINEFITLREMQKFFAEDGIRRLDDVIELKLKNNKTAALFDYSVMENKDLISVILPGKENKIKQGDHPGIKDENKRFELPLYTCPSTGFKFFYFLLPVEYLNNDIELQPRPLEFKRLWELYRHLLVNSQLTPSACRLKADKIYLFDGQHKAAAQIWAGRKEIECKIYLEPSIKVLKETNLIAHDKLRQMPFFTSVLIKKWASIFSEEWTGYMERPGDKSEAGFVSFLISRGKKKAEALNMIESNIYDTILEDSNNKIRPFIEDYGSGSKKPVTVNRLKQSFFKRFIANPPLLIDIEESDRLRENERVNNVRLLNLITGYSLDGMWNPEKNDERHKVAEKIYLNGSFKAICSIIKDTITTALELFDENDRKEIFLRNISEDDWSLIENSIDAIFSNRVWHDNSEENYNNLRVSNESSVRKYLARRGLSVNWILNSSLDSGNNFID